MTMQTGSQVCAHDAVGDPRAQNELLESLRPRLVKFLGRRGVASDILDDVVQETLVLVWRRLGTLRKPDRLWAWAATIALNRLRSHLQRAPRFEEMPEDLEGPLELPGRRILREEAREWLRQSLSTIRPEYRAAIELRVGCSMPPAEAAKALGVSRTRLRKFLHQGLRNVRTDGSKEGRFLAHALGIAS